MISVKTNKVINIYPDFNLIYLELKKIPELNITLEELKLQNKILQGILYRGINNGAWGVDKLYDTIKEEYLFLNKDKINIDWHFQCLFLHQRLKGEFDLREAKYGTKRITKITKLEDKFCTEFTEGIKINKIKFNKIKTANSDNLVSCLDYFWKIEQ